MSDRNCDQLPDDLEQIARHLRAGRAHADPLQLDRLKQRLMAQSESRPRRLTFMKSRIATVLTVLGLVGGTGGALALAGTGSSGGPHGGAASGQYRPGKGCGDKNHHHSGSGCPKG
jgi:hypothetical protein